MRHVGGQSTIGRSQGGNVPAQDDRLTWSGTRRSDMSTNASNNTSSTLTAVPPRKGSADSTTLTSSIAAKGDLPPVPSQTAKKFDSTGTVKLGLPNGVPEAKARAPIQRESSDEYEDYDDDYRGQEAGQSGNGAPHEELPDTTILDSVVLPALASVRHILLYSYHMISLNDFQLFPRVSTQEARVALSTLQRAFTEAERIIPGVTMELVNEIVDSVEHVEDDR